MSRSTVILLKKSPVGTIGAHVSLRRGFARYLIAQRQALFATHENVAYFEAQCERLMQEEAERLLEAQKLAERMANTYVAIAHQIGEGNKLQGSVTTRHISDALTAQGFLVSAKTISLRGPIRTLGEHTVDVRLHADVVLELVVRVFSSARSLEEALTLSTLDASAAAAF